MFGSPAARPRAYRLHQQVLGLGFAQTIAWGSSTYLPAALAQAMASDLQLAASTVFAFFSLALGMMALLGPAIGRRIDRHGGRLLLAAASLVLSMALSVLAFAHSPLVLLAGWLLLGVGMAAGLYDAVFAALVREHGPAARRAITGVTLLGGFASTLAWPLSSWLVEHADWRQACLCWAALNLLVALPLNLRYLQAAKGADQPPAVAGSTGKASAVNRRRQVILLALFSAATAFVASAMAAHLPRLLVAGGLAPAAAIAAAALFGPAQVLARIAEYLCQLRWHNDALRSARLACALHPLGASCLLLLGSTALPASLFVILHGAGNGLVSIARGVLPLHLFGAAGYGELQGRLAIAQRLMQSIAPYCLALVLEAGGHRAALLLSLTVALLAWAALLALRPEQAGSAPGEPLAE